MLHGTRFNLTIQEKKQIFKECLFLCQATNITETMIENTRTYLSASWEGFYQLECVSNRWFLSRGRGIAPQFYAGLIGLKAPTN